MDVKSYEKPEYYVNRELSWIKFNERVLSEARDKTLPLFERLKFLSITSSNLDEFYERSGSCKVHESGHFGADSQRTTEKYQREDT